MKIAVLFGHGSGRSPMHSRTGMLLLEKLSCCEVYTCRGCCGEAYLPGAAVVPHDIAEGYEEDIGCMVNSLLDIHPDLFICVGGDGLAAYTASALIARESRIPMMGIAAGTANVGPIISVAPEDLKTFDPAGLKIIDAGAVRVGVGKRFIGYGFNDVVIGNTFLGTFEEKIVNFSVEAMVRRGEKIIEEPADDIAADGFKVEKNGVAVDYSIKRPAQVIISPLEADRFYGRAIVGALCISAYSPLKAAVALFDTVIIRSGSDDKGVSCFMPVEHLLFGAGDIVSISGLSPKGHVIIDGNPYLREEESVTFEYMPGLIKIARPAI